MGFDEQVIAIYSPNNAKNGIKRGTDSVKGPAEQRSRETDTGRHCLSVAACVGPVVTQLLCYCYMTETTQDRKGYYGSWLQKDFSSSWCERYDNRAVPICGTTGPGQEAVYIVADQDAKLALVAYSFLPSFTYLKTLQLSKQCYKLGGRMLKICVCMPGATFYSLCEGCRIKSHLCPIKLTHAPL